MYAMFLLLQATESWLQLPRNERRRLSEEHVGGALKQYPALRMRYFDAEAFSAEISDVMLIETDDLQQYNDFMETLRDSPLLSRPYFRVRQIVPSVEGGYQGFEARSAAFAPA